MAGLRRCPDSSNRGRVQADDRNGFQISLSADVSLAVAH